MINNWVLGALIGALSAWRLRRGAVVGNDSIFVTGIQTSAFQGRVRFFL